MNIKKKKKIIIISIIIIAIILIVALIGVIVSKTRTSTAQKNSVNDFKNIEELVEYYDCDYISIKKSEEEGFDKDISLVFSEDPISQSGQNNQYIYNSIISGISAKMNNKNFRIIDETRSITVRIYFLADNKVTYTINNDNDFFNHLVSKYTIDNEQVENITNVQTNSRLLTQIVNNNWKTTNIDLGTIDSIVDKYDIYFDEGYKIRKINGKVYNIIFTNKYNLPVVNNLKPTASIEEVQNVFGNPTYSSSLETEGSLIGYKTDYFYMFFTGDELSIYPNQEMDNQDEFAELLTKYMKDKNAKEFLSKLTDIWPDYSRYTLDESYIHITYPLRGIEFEFDEAVNLKIQLYNNYNGKITNEISMQDVKNNKTLPQYVNVSLNENLIEIAEIERVQTDSRNRVPWDMAETLLTNKYAVFLHADENRCSFYSTNKENIDSVLEVSGLNNIYTLNDEIFIYSIEGNGIYAYNATNKGISEIVLGSETYKIDKVENNTIYYDNTQITVNI